MSFKVDLSRVEAVVAETSAVHGVVREEVSTRLEAIGFIESNRWR